VPTGIQIERLHTMAKHCSCHANKWSYSVLKLIRQSSNHLIVL